MMWRAFWVALVAQACSYTMPAVSQYDLVGRVGVAKRTSSSATVVVAVRRFAAASAYDGDQIALRLGKVRLEYYRYHRWVSSTPDLVTELLAARWDASGRFARVDLDDVEPDVSLVVSGRILAFEELALPGRAPRAHVVLEITGSAPQGAPIYRQSLERQVPLKGRSVGFLVAALRSGVGAIALESAERIEAAGLRARKDRQIRESGGDDPG